jgi:beta-galactosidase
MLVMDENRMLGSDRQHMDRFEAQVRRDRNHPSVAIWSLGNEEFAVERTPSGTSVAASMQALVKRLDPTRPVTINADLGNEFVGVNQAVEVRGWSYHVGKGMDAYHQEHPLQPNVGSEQGSTVGTRGIYAKDAVRGYVSAYDDNAPEWAQSAETWLSFFAPRPWLSGAFVWTGFDYRGEPTPYGWPCISSHFGIMDTCGFPKDNFWYFQSWWTDRPVLHILPHWNWAGREGKGIDVRALSNCDEVELFLNGQSLGRQPVSIGAEPRWTVPYAPGVISARGFNGGRPVADASVETTGAPAAVRLTADRPAVDANGEDLAIFTVSIVDAKGRVVPDAGKMVSFDLEGPGRIIGVGNGDPSCHEPDTLFAVAPFRTIPVDGWRWRSVADPYPPSLPEEGIVFDDSGWVGADVRSDTSQLGPRGKAVFRGRLTLAASDCSAPVIELCFGKIEGGIAVYVNGSRVGGSSDSRSAPVYDVKALVHPGENVFAVAAANYGTGTAGLSHGVVLRLQEEPPAVHWGRSTFNGLAQVIARSSREAGEIRLVARSEGLEPATCAVAALPAVPRPWQP